MENREIKTMSFFEKVMKWLFKIQDFINKEGMLKAILSSSLNLLIYAILIVSIVYIPQGTVMTIDMYFGTGVNIWINLALFHFLLFFLTIIMSTYPTYIYHVFFSHSTNLKWEIKKWGLIYFTEPIESDIKPSVLEISASKTEKTTEAFFRKFFSGLLLIIYPALLIWTFHNYSTDPSSTIILSVILILIILIFTLIWGKYLKGFNIYDPAQSVSALKRKYVSLILIVSFLPLAVIGWITQHHQFSILTICSELFYSFLLLTVFAIVRVKRQIIFGEKYINYLQFLRIMGLIVLFVFLLTNISSKYALLINPTNQLLIFLIAIYTVIAYAFKLFLYSKYKAGNHHKHQNRGLHLLGFWVVMISFGSWIIIKMVSGGKLHELQMVPKDCQNELSLKQHIQSYDESLMDSSSELSLKRPILYAAYGGGLKANYWNSLLIDNIGAQVIREKTLAMSGVSGGGVGIGSYVAKEYANIKNKLTTHTNYTDTIGRSNVLGIELPWFFGFDLLRTLLPDFAYNSHDRSNRSMDYYSNVFYGSNALSDSISFIKVMDDLTKHYGYFPNLIINSTSTTDKYGVVSRIQDIELFPGSIDLLFNNISADSSLTFFEAVSTCNRFPVISPRATVPYKGHFVDGGYFENSGIVSLLSFYHRTKKEAKRPIRKPILISVRNDLNNYLQRLLIDNGLESLINQQEIKTVKALGGSEVILNTVSGTDKMPNYLRGVLDPPYSDEFEMIFLDLPYYIRDKDINSYFVGNLPDSTYNLVEKIIEKSNQEILTCLNKVNYDYKKHGLYNPPTARMLSEPVVQYMKAMLQTDSIQARITRIQQI